MVLLEESYIFSFYPFVKCKETGSRRTLYILYRENHLHCQCASRGT